MIARAPRTPITIPSSQERGFPYLVLILRALFVSHLAFLKANTIRWGGSGGRNCEAAILKGRFRGSHEPNFRKMALSTIVASFPAISEPRLCSYPLDRTPCATCEQLSRKNSRWVVARCAVVVVIVVGGVMVNGVGEVKLVAQKKWKKATPLSHHPPPTRKLVAKTAKTYYLHTPRNLDKRPVRSSPRRW